eukprot:2975418-Amphidinium_carterae.1
MFATLKIHQMVCFPMVCMLSLQPLSAGRDASLAQLLLWKSVAARNRSNARLFMDVKRPKGSSKIYAISDLHFDYRSSACHWQNPKFQQSISENHQEKTIKELLQHSWSLASCIDCPEVKVPASLLRPGQC